MNLTAPTRVVHKRKTDEEGPDRTDQKGKCATKRILAIVLVVMMSLCAVLAFAESDEVPDEAAVLELCQKAYEANKLETVFGNHESVAYTISYPGIQEEVWYIWQTSDGVYNEFGLDWAEFVRGNVDYMMSRNKETGAMEVSCNVFCDADHDPYFQIVPETEEEFCNSEHEQITRIFEEDGLICEIEELDETASQVFIEEMLGLEYDGQLIRAENYWDAQTYETVKIVTFMIQDGEETVVCVYDVEYDVPEPVACRVLRACFERESENMMTETVVIDYGTDHEFSQEVTVPVNTEMGVRHTMPVVMFSDPECETLTHWNRLSDHTEYVFTNPDDALIEKYQTLLDQMNTNGQTEEPDAATFEALVAANTGKEILSRHANYEMNITDYLDGEVIHTDSQYTDTDTWLFCSGDGQAMLFRANLRVERDPEDERSEFCEVLFDTEEAFLYQFEQFRDGDHIILNDLEPLLETIDSGDGQFTAITEITDPEFVEMVLAENEPMGGYAYAEGMTLRYEYVFDTQSSDLLSTRAFLIDAEGEEQLMQELSCAYDVEACDPVGEGEPFAGYPIDATDPERSRVITLIFAPDTENEHTMVYSVPQDVRISTFYNDQFVELDRYYTDRECTQVFEGSDGETDLVLYVK